MRCLKATSTSIGAPAFEGAKGAPRVSWPTNFGAKVDKGQLDIRITGRSSQPFKSASHSPKAAGFGMKGQVVQPCCYPRGIYIDKQGRVPECQALNCRCDVIPDPGERQEFLPGRALLPVEAIKLLCERQEVLYPPLQANRLEKRPEIFFARACKRLWSWVPVLQSNVDACCLRCPGSSKKHLCDEHEVGILFVAPWEPSAVLPPPCQKLLTDLAGGSFRRMLGNHRDIHLSSKTPGLCIC